MGVRIELCERFMTAAIVGFVILLGSLFVGVGGGGSREGVADPEVVAGSVCYSRIYLIG